jgi:hypothetical protein
MSGTNTQQQQVVATQNNLTPSEGPRVIPVTLNFALAASLGVNLSYQQQQQQISVIQSAYIDNSLNAAPFTIVIGNNLQSITIPAGNQAYVNFDCPNPPQFTCSCSGGNAVKVLFQNFETQPYMWNAAGNTTPLPVSDATLDSAFSSGALNVNVVSPNPLPVSVVSGGSTAPTINNTKVYGTSGTPGQPIANSTGSTIWAATIFNTTTGWAFLHILNSYSGVGGTDFMCIGCPPGQSVTMDMGTYGVTSASGGLSAYITGGGASGDTTAITTGGAVGATFVWSYGAE